ncbi:MAG: hypothetical protein A2020_07820 [Lentisphaerae bacterium GWF2_45_14]|nr:MAG: hypothetical protein A2020_07820 [Lentisphaerae bacterium GWF2_45_14]
MRIFDNITRKYGIKRERHIDKSLNLLILIVNKPGGTLKTLRSFEIVDFLKEKKYCSMNNLMEHFDVSPATIHRDVSELARKKLIQKVHGGIALPPEKVETKKEGSNSHFSDRIDKNTDKKSVIANKAAAEISDGDIIFLDSSTTAFHLAQKLQKTNFSNLTIITNSVLIIQEFYLFPPHFILISTGGNFNCQLNSFLGQSARENLHKLKIDKAFFSAVGITKNGISTFHENHAEFLKEVLGIADTNYLLIDSTKFDKSGIFPICSRQKIDFIMSDIQVPEAHARH